MKTFITVFGITIYGIMLFGAVLGFFYFVSATKAQEIDRAEYTCQQIRNYVRDNSPAQVAYIVGMMTEEEKYKALRCFSRMERRILKRRYG